MRYCIERSREKILSIFIGMHTSRNGIYATPGGVQYGQQGIVTLPISFLFAYDISRWSCKRTAASFSLCERGTCQILCSFLRWCCTRGEIIKERGIRCRYSGFHARCVRINLFIYTYPSVTVRVRKIHARHVFPIFICTYSTYICTFAKKQ